MVHKIIHIECPAIALRVCVCVWRWMVARYGFRLSGAWNRKVQEHNVVGSDGEKQNGP